MLILCSLLPFFVRTFLTCLLSPFISLMPQTCCAVHVSEMLSTSISITTPSTQSWVQPDLRNSSASRSASLMILEDRR